MNGQRLLEGPRCRMQIACTKCPLLVKCERDALKFRCPLYPRKRTFAHAIRMSALGQCVDGSELARTFFTNADTDGKCATAETEAKDFRIRFVISAKKAIEVQDVAFEAPPKCDVLSLAFVKHQRLLGSN
jgi:hypothetical protein